MYPIPSEVVDQYYRMDPETEDVLMDSYELRNGMIILLESIDDRAALKESPSTYEYHNIIIRNRWCQVSNLRQTMKDGTRHIAFLAEYVDGRKVKRMWPAETSWLVKKNSVPQPPNRETDPTAAMELLGNIPSKTVLTSFDTGETIEIEHNTTPEDRTVYKDEKRNPGY